MKDSKYINTHMTFMHPQHYNVARSRDLSTSHIYDHWSGATAIPLMYWYLHRDNNNDPDLKMSIDNFLRTTHGVVTDLPNNSYVTDDTYGYVPCCPVPWDIGQSTRRFYLSPYNIGRYNDRTMDWYAQCLTVLRGGYNHEVILAHIYWARFTIRALLRYNKTLPSVFNPLGDSVTGRPYEPAGLYELPATIDAAVRLLEFICIHGSDDPDSNFYYNIFLHSVNGIYTKYNAVSRFRIIPRFISATSHNITPTYISLISNDPKPIYGVTTYEEEAIHNVPGGSIIYSSHRNDSLRGWGVTGNLELIGRCVNQPLNKIKEVMSEYIENRYTKTNATVWLNNFWK